MKKDKKNYPGFQLENWILFVLYLLLLIYLVFFSEQWGRTADNREYQYNLELFKEISRFVRHRGILGSRRVLLNLAGNVLAFMPFGFFLAKLRPVTRRWYRILFFSFSFSLFIETMQLVFKVGIFDVDDILLNTIGGLIGYLIYLIYVKIRRHSDGEDPGTGKRQSVSNHKY